jgi:hypothetical protein
MAGGVAVMGWWRNAYAGQKVVYRCSIGPWIGGEPVGGNPLAVGDVVEIKQITADPDFSAGVGFFFGHYDAMGSELWYSAHRFRPVQTKSTDTGMSILKRILNGAQ